MYGSVLETLKRYRREANSCSDQAAYKKIDEITSVLAEEVPLVQSKKYIISKPYNRASDIYYTEQLGYLKKMIDLKIAEIAGIEKMKDEKIVELQDDLAMITKEKNVLEKRYNSLCSAFSELEEKYNKVLKELEDKDKSDGTSKKPGTSRK